MNTSHEKRNRISKAIEHGSVRIGSDFSSDYLLPGEEPPKNPSIRELHRRERKWRRLAGEKIIIPKEALIFQDSPRERTALYNKIKRISKSISDRHAYALASGVSEPNLCTVNNILKGTRITDLKTKLDCLGLDKQSLDGLIIDYLGRLCRCKAPYQIEWH